MVDVNGWFALAGALGGVAIGGVIGLVTAVLNQKWQARAAEQNSHIEQERQLRQERRETYADYWRAWNSLIRVLERSTDRTAEAVDRIAVAEAEWRHAIDPMFILCSRGVLKAGIEHLRTTEARIAAALEGRRLDGAGRSRALSRAMREDLWADRPSQTQEGPSYSASQ
ncbi:hypothetical protein ACFPOI_51245 [Nonomuraea angiospora]|uniref:Gas vesicle protein n=1 Tax=Nonomuraea angiospora TaxID=46172 RepID=A0ABR9M2A9_9ACTN|nr:hypothetical protein [Nonomuraea angiospora]MBE1586735.1 gas vesicle protein [Nonomuraea angiospora]